MSIGTAFRNDYIGDGAHDTYAFTFKIFVATDLKVIVSDTDGNESELAYGSGYTVSGAGTPSGGTITLVDGELTSGYTLSIERNRPVSQTTDFKNQAAFFPLTHEDSFDHLVMLAQRLNGLLARAVRLREGTPIAGYSMELPVPEAGKAIGWNATADEIVNLDVDNINPASIDAVNVPFLQSGAGAVERSTRSKNRDTFSVDDFGCAGDGTTDDTIPFQAALTAISGAGLTAAKLRVPRSYKITSALTIPTNITLVGEGANRSKIIKAFNGDLMTLGNGAGLRDLWIDGGNSSGFTGRGVLMGAATFNQKIRDCRIDNMESYCIEWTAAAAGSSSKVVDCNIGGRNLPYIAMKMPNDAGSAAPRHLVNIDTGGSVLVDVNGANNLFIKGGRNNGLAWSGGATTSGNVTIDGSRIGNVASMAISGSQTVLTNCIFGAAIEFDANSDNCQMTNCIVPGWDITDNGASNVFDIGYKEYTPTWDQAAGTQPALGNGTITGTYSRNGKTVILHIRLTMGGTTTFGNGANAYRFSIPYASLNGLMPQFGTAFIFDTSAGTTTTHEVFLGPNEAIVFISAMTGGASVRDAVPIAWANGDRIDIFIHYVAD